MPRPTPISFVRKRADTTTTKRLKRFLNRIDSDQRALQEKDADPRGEMNSETHNDTVFADSCFRKAVIPTNQDQQWMKN